MDDPLAQSYFPVLSTRRDGSILAISATEGMLSMDSNARSASTSDNGGSR